VIVLKCLVLSERRNKLSCPNANLFLVDVEFKTKIFLYMKIKIAKNKRFDVVLLTTSDFHTRFST